MILQKEKRKSATTTNKIYTHPHRNLFAFICNQLRRYSKWDNIVVCSTWLSWDAIKNKVHLSNLNTLLLLLFSLLAFCLYFFSLWSSDYFCRFSEIVEHVFIHYSFNFWLNDHAYLFYCVDKIWSVAATYHKHLSMF